jgi:4-amino-4-deoxy-L-arabinose transferase-like glycosyltransferase
VAHAFPAIRRHAFQWAAACLDSRITPLAVSAGFTYLGRAFRQPDQAGTVNQGQVVVENTRRGWLAPWALPVLIALAAALLTVFVGFRAQSLVDTRFDPYYFGKMGASLASGDGFTPFGSLIKRRAPLYPLAIGGVYWLFGVRPLLVLLLQCLLHAGTCLLVYSLARRLFTQRTALIASVLCAVHPMLLRYVPDLHLEALFTFLVTLLVWLTERFVRSSDFRNAFWLGLVSGLATLTKSVILLYPPLFAAVLLLVRLRAKQRLPLPALILVGVTMAATIAPWTVRNYVVTGHFVPVSTGFSDAFLRGLIFSRTEFITLQKAPYTHAENESNIYFRRLAREAGTVWEKDDWETDQILNREMKRRLVAEPWLNVRRFFVGLVTFWYQMTSLATSAVVGGLALVAWIFACVGIRRSYREDRTVWLVLLPIFYLNVLLAALLALGRYHAPILPCLLILAAYGLDGLLPKRDAGRV